MCDLSKLKGRIVEKFGTMGSFSAAVGMSQRTLGLKMSGKIDWKTSEIMKAINLLELKPEDVPDYFFTFKV